MHASYEERFKPWDFKSFVILCKRFLKQYLDSLPTTRSSYIYIYIYMCVCVCVCVCYDFEY